MSAVQSKLTPISASCIEYVHPWTDHCATATAGLLLQAAQESFRIYSAVYTLSLLMRLRIPNISDLKKTFLGIIQSTGFLTTSAFTYSLFLCLLRHHLGSFNFFTVSYVPAFMSSMCALLIERPSRRNLLCLYVSNVATETLFNMACSRGICRPIPYGQVWIFGISISVMLYYFRRGLHQLPVTAVQAAPNQTNNNTIFVNHKSKDSIYDILRFVVGRHEECVPALQLPPQYLSRRRERDGPAITASGIQHEQHQPSRPNSIIATIMQVVQYYTRLVNYVKYTLPRHRSCPHLRNSCVHYVLDGGTKLFMIGCGIQATLKCLIQFKAISRDPIVQLKKIFGSSETLKLGAFLGGFSAIYRLGSCSLRHIFGSDNPRYAIPAALVASTAFMFYPDTTVSLYVFWKALQISYNIGADAGYLPRVPYFVFILYSLSTATLFHAATLEPTNLRSSYWKFLHSLSGGRMAVMDRRPLDVYGLETSKQLAEVLFLTKTKKHINFVL